MADVTDINAVKARVREALQAAKVNGRGTFDALEPYEAVVAASIDDTDLEALLAYVERLEGERERLLCAGVFCSPSEYMTRTTADPQPARLTLGEP